MILELHNFISDEQLSFIKDRLDTHTTNTQAVNKLGSYRDGRTVFISKVDELKDLDTFLHKKVFGSSQLLEYINKRYKPSFSSIDTGYEFHRYEPGAICNVHGDGEVLKIDNSNVGFIRFASLVLHLNTPDNGGDLVFPGLNKTVKTEAKKVVVFPPYNFAQHYTTPSTENRDVIVTWFAYDKIKVILE